MSYSFASGRPPAESTARSIHDSNHVRQQSWRKLTSSCANLSIKRDSKPNEIADPLAPAPTGRVAPQKNLKRTADGSVKDEQTWEMSGLERSLFHRSTEAVPGHVKLSMDMDILRRRIAVIEACEKGKELRASILGQSQNSQERNNTWKSGRAKDTLDWKEAVLR
ncbi:hypothetical protein LTR10_022668 [Elasticomyces elasticus]|nr:hypothetical protein LTR10_022668 [Elasticomyces elasticus]KAK5043216.1 hypothetical protein LTR13_000987 [Exophiala sideris]